MSEEVFSPRAVSSITCVAHHSIREAITRAFRSMKLNNVFVENGKTVRQHIRPRRLGLPGAKIRLHESPMEIFRCTVSSEHAHAVMQHLIEAGDLHIPGRGMIMSRDITEYGDLAAVHPVFTSEKEAAAPLDGKGELDRYAFLPDLSLITCILSKPGSGNHLARIALDLGTCVPYVTNAIGTGLRDNIGLLRITIPPEKEVIHLVVPEHDANSIIRLLTEEAGLNLPGHGFLYRTRLSAGVLDTRLRIGRQEHAASIEQIITAIDELKAGTHWRKRFTRLDQGYTDTAIPLTKNNREVVFTCKEGSTGPLVEEAMRRGAGGATTARVRRLRSTSNEGDTAARERSSIIVEPETADNIVQSLNSNPDNWNNRLDSIQVIEVPAVLPQNG